MKILVVGASGMIGSTVLRVLAEASGYQVYGTIRDSSALNFFNPHIRKLFISGIDVMGSEGLLNLFEKLRPEIVINCAGLTKHRPGAEDPLVSVPINTLLPHRLALFCRLVGARLIHVSTDCVFSGIKGYYKESDFPDATDVYGKSKILGEVDYTNSITLRTSTIGHELQTRYGLLNWFLSQTESCKGFSRAIFSGLPTVVFAEIIRDVVIPHNELCGIFHVAAKPINKFELLDLIAKVYKKEIEIIEDDSVRIDRSLNSDRFKLATGYQAPEWSELVNTMHQYK